MCGIFAVYKFDLQTYTPDVLLSGVHKVYHRGPDNHGSFLGEHCFLGHTRLAIIDTGDHANQPFHFENLVMVYNGEVFNYIELRNELITLGYSFETSSDTEVVLKAYHAWKDQCFSRFNGMWALVIYDQKTHAFLVSRDRFGQKPLFVMVRHDGVFIASEIQQIVQYSDHSLNFGAIQMFLKDGTYEETPGQTFFKEINVFPKASYAYFYLDKPYETHRYWRYPEQGSQPVTAHSFEAFQTLLNSAVSLRQRSDVPYGILLSGGVDSTIIAALAAKFKQNDSVIPAFVYASHDADDESYFATQIARELGMGLEILEQDTHPENYIARLRGIVQHLGQGHSSPAIVSSDYIYERVAEKGIRVALDGQGADEIMAGYKVDFPLRIVYFLARGKFRQACAMMKNLWQFGELLFGVYFVRIIAPPFLRKMMRTIFGYEKLFVTVEKTPCTFEGALDEDNVKGQSLINRLSIKRHQIGLTNLLYYGDILSMKNSVENRSPFMDHRLVEFVFKSQDDFSVWDGKAKKPLRVLEEYKRFESLLNRKKIGFSSNINLETKKKMVALLRISPILVWPIFDSELLKAFLEEDLLKPKYERFLFRLFQVHLFCDIFVSNNPLFYEKSSYSSK